MYTGCTLSNFDLIIYVVKMWNFPFSDKELKTKKTLGTDWRRYVLYRIKIVIVYIHILTITDVIDSLKEKKYYGKQ